MKICIAQALSYKGDVSRNIKNHLSFIRKAAQLGANLIVFPELSLTGYEPTIAKNLAVTIDDPALEVFQELANQCDLLISVGVPLKQEEGTSIGMLIFQSHQDRISYSKQLLHEDELPYFIPGNNQTYVHINDKKIAFGICYESMQRDHFINAIEEKSKIYIASVAKHANGVNQAKKHFQQLSKEFSTPILMVNSVEQSDGFTSAGQSSIWNKDGKLLSSLDQERQELLYFDAESEHIEIHAIIDQIS